VARKITTTIPLAEIYFEEEVYPRTQPSWQTSYIYSQNMLSGSKFPPITLALFNGKKYLVDGKHRYEAHKLLKKKVIKVEIFSGWTKRKIFEEAIIRNVAHGQVLSPYEKRKLILRLRAMKYKDRQISRLINVPQDKLVSFVGQRLVSTTTGKVIVDTVIKSAFKHKAGGQYSQEEINIMENTAGQTRYHGQVTIFNQVVELFENNLVDLDNKIIYQDLIKIKGFLKSVK